MEKDFLTITPDSGSGNGSLNVVATANNGAARDSSVIVAGSGITKTVAVSQEEGTFLITHFEVTLVSPTLYLHGSDGDGRFALEISILDASSGQYKGKEIVCDPGIYPDGSGVTITLTEAENIRVAKKDNVGVRIKFLNIIDFDGESLSTITLQSIRPVAPAGWTLTPVSLSQQFTKTPGVNITRWANPKVSIKNISNVMFDAIATGTTDAGVVGTWVLKLN